MEPWSEFDRVKFKVDISTCFDLVTWPVVLVGLIISYARPTVEVSISRFDLGGCPRPKLEVSPYLDRLFVRRGKHHKAFWAVVNEDGKEEQSRASKSRSGDGHRPTSVLFQRVANWAPKSLTIYEDSECVATLTARSMSLSPRHNLEQVVIATGVQAAESRVCRKLSRRLQSLQTRYVVASVRQANFVVSTWSQGTETETEKMMALPKSFGAWHVLGVAAIESLVFVHVAVSDHEALLLVEVAEQPFKPASEIFKSFPTRPGKILGITNFGFASVVVGLTQGLDTVCLFKFSSELL